MTVQERTFWFNLFVIVFNIILGILVEGVVLGLCMLAVKAYPGVFGGTDGSIASSFLPFILLAGLIIAMYISVKCISWIIEKFHLEDKLDEKLVKRYVKKEL